MPNEKSSGRPRGYESVEGKNVQANRLDDRKETRGVGGLCGNSPWARGGCREYNECPRGPIGNRRLALNIELKKQFVCGLCLSTVMFADSDCRAQLTNCTTRTLEAGLEKELEFDLHGPNNTPTVQSIRSACPRCFHLDSFLLSRSNLSKFVTLSESLFTFFIVPSPSAVLSVCLFWKTSKLSIILIP